MLTLASRSPQRRAILEQLGVPFTVEVPEVDEVTEGEPRALVIENARRKARAVRGEHVLGADTAVVLDGRIFGKPRDRSEADGFLRRLSGRTHTVWSGMALVQGSRERTAAVAARVGFRELEGELVDWYLASEEWRERAGGYAVQGRGAALVKEIEGDYTAVVGLPVTALLELAPELVVGERL